MIEKSAYGYTIEKDGVYLDIEFFESDIVRFVYSKERHLPKVSQSIVREPKLVKVKLDKNIIETDKLKIEIDENTLKTRIYNLEGVLLSEDKEILSRKKPAKRKHSGEWTLAERSEIAMESYRGRDESCVKLVKNILWETGYYGLGEKYGYLNKKGYKTQNWCSDVLAHTPVHTPVVEHYHTSIPFFIGADTQKAYGIFFDTRYKNSFDFGKYKKDVVEISADGGIVDYYFINGPKISDVVEKYSYLTGYMEMPDKKYLGYQQCRWSYVDSDEVIQTAEKFVSENIPCDVIYLDIDYMEAYKVFTVDKERFSDFKKMAKRLKELAIKLVVIIDPGVKVEEGYSVYDDGLEKGYFVTDKNGKTYVGQVWPGDSVFPDFLRTDVQKWWGDLHKTLFDMGVDGIWNDMNEPADASNEEKTLPETALHFDDNGKKHTHDEIHNIYGMLEAKATYDAMLNYGIDRPFILTRAAAAGSQRYAALWTGDNASIWEHLEASIPMFLNLGLSGYPWIGGDVGGFMGDTNPELFLRWIQLGIFTPFFRNHSSLGTMNQEPWVFNNQINEIVKSNIEERYKLIDHIYSLFYKAHTKGTPIIAPLFYYYQEDKETYGVHEGFLFGENMLVYPIVRPEVTRKMVYLPKGVWYDYWNNTKYDGEKWIIVEVILEKMPVFIKSGSVVLENAVNRTVVYDSAEIVAKVYGEDDFTQSFYFDDGKSKAYKSGEYSVAEIRQLAGEIKVNQIEGKGKMPNIVIKKI